MPFVLLEQNASAKVAKFRRENFFIMAKTFTNPLDSIKVASPCSADWEAMVGNNRQRHCGECKLDVYNLSGMTRQEAENLIMNSEGRVCARFYRRPDGTVITKDCPVGWQAVKQRMSKVWTAVASIMITAVSGIGITAFMSQNNESIVMGNVAIENPNPRQNNFEINEEPELIMGDIAEPANEQPRELMGRVAMPSK
jgi:hypothetical protein